MNTKLALSSSLIALTAGSVVAQTTIYDSLRIANAGSFTNGFGKSIDTSDGIIAVSLGTSEAAPIASPDRGELILIDASTGVTLWRLIPSSPDPVGGLQEVAIEGSTAVIGNGTGEFSQASVFAFDVTTGTQRFELEPDAEDLLPQYFGQAIDVGSGVVAVGFPFYNLTVPGDINSLIGKVELYDEQSGVPLGELESNVPGIAEGFGNAVDIHNGKIAVSSFQTIELAFDGSAESVIVFDIASHLELFRVGPSPSINDDAGFGSSISMNDEFLVVAAPRDDTAGQNSGSVFVFDAVTGDYLHTLDIGALPNPEPSTGPDIEVDINDEGMIVVSIVGGAANIVSLHEASTGARLGTLVQNSVPGGSDQNGLFGTAVAIDGSSIFVSDPGLIVNNGRVPSLFRFDSPATIATQPASLIVDDANQNMFMQVVASNADSYQWYLDGNPISDGPTYIGTNTSVLNITPGTDAEGVYTVEVGSIAFGSVLSDPAYYVYRGPVIPSCPADQNFDGFLSPADFSAWISNYNNGCE